MTIEKNGGVYVLICDVCGEKAEEDFGGFYDAVDYRNTHGWETRPDFFRAGEWENVCPHCQEEELGG